MKDETVDVYNELVKKYSVSLKDASKDDDGNKPVEFMNNCNFQLVNFDNLKDDYVKGLHLAEIPLSNDALYYNEETQEYCFIEFKNGKIDTKKNAKIKFKILESILIFLDLINKSINYSKSSMRYILVYNENADHNSSFFNGSIISDEVQPSTERNNLQKAILGLAKKELINFGLARYQNIYFKEVHTYNKVEFEKLFIEPLCSKCSYDCN